MTAPTVTGGSGGITAHRPTIEHLAALHRTAAGELQLRSLLLAAALDGGSCLDAITLDPAGAIATTRTGADALAALRRVLRELDDLAGKLDNAAQGYPWGGSVFDAALGDTLRGIFASFAGLGVTGRPAAALGGGGGDPDGRIAGLDPKTVDLLTSLLGPAELARLAPDEPDGTGVAVATGSAQVPAPRTLADVVSGLADVDREGSPGGIDVRIVVGPDGRRAAIVDITGTRTWTAGGTNVADLVTNQRALIGRPTAYAQGVLAAMHRAGVRRGDDVMVVGHSQGGMVAVDVARQATRSGAFRVTHVMTAGSPVGLTVGTLPPSVRVLTLENDRDLVPRLDHRTNPDRANVTTVTGRAGDGTIGGNHALDRTYVPLASQAQAGGSRSVRGFVGSAGAFLDGLHVTQHTYRVERH